MNADQMQQWLRAGQATPETFRATLTSVPATERDGWGDRVLGLDEIPDDSEALPRGCVPRAGRRVRRHRLGSRPSYDTDAFPDGADTFGLEIQPPLVAAARDLTARLNTPRVAVIQGDAAELTRHIEFGTVFFLY